MILKSKRLEQVKRVFDPYQDRSRFVRFDRNEDPTGYSQVFFHKWLSSLTVHDIAAYADSTNLLEKLARWLKLSTDNLYISAGSDAVIKNIFETYIDQGQEVLFQNPCWRMYDVYASIYGAKVHQVTYNENLDFNFDEVMQKVQKSEIRMIILANPNQPTGTLFTKASLNNLLEECKKRNTIVVIDEAYHLFTDFTMAEAIHDYENLIVVRTFSKAFGMAGLRLGYALAQKDRINELMLLRPVTDSNSLALSFAEFLLDHREVVEAKIKDYVAGREYLYKVFGDAGLETYESYTNFLLIRCPSRELGQKILEETKEKGYLLKGVFTFFPLENCIRVTIGPQELMKRFWEDCQEILLKYGRCHTERKQGVRNQ